MTPDPNRVPLPVPPLTDDAAQDAPKAAAQDAPTVGPRTSARPDGGGLSDYPTLSPTAEPLAVQLDGRTSDALNFATEQLESGRAELSEVVGQLANELASELNATGALLSSVTDEVIGAAELDLSRADEPLNRLLFNVVKAANGELDTLMDGARDVGLEIPWAAAHQAMQAELPVFDQVAQVVPALAKFIQPSAAAEPLAPTGPTDSASVDVPGFAPPVAPPVPPPPVPASGYSSTIVYAPLPAVAPLPVPVPVPVPGYSPPPPPPPPVVSGAACPPPHVTVNVAPAPVFVLPGGVGAVPTAPTGEVPECEPPEPPLPPAPPSPLEIGGTGQTPIERPYAQPPSSPKERGNVPGERVPGTTEPPRAGPLGGTGPGGTPAPLDIEPLPEQYDGPLLPKWSAAEQLRCLPRGGPPPAWMLKNAALLDLPSRIGEDLGTSGLNDWQWNDPRQIDAFEQSLMAPRGRAGRILANLAQVFGTRPKAGVPRPQRALQVGALLAVANKAERATDAPFTYLFQSELYEFQAANPQYLPTQVRTDDAYLTAQIDERTWNAWTRANGNLPEPARRTMLANARRLSVDEAITLYRRGGINRAELAHRMRLQGVLDPCLGDEYLAITEALPTQSDLVRFMVRDAADQSVVDRYGLDTDFEQKYSGPLKRWGQALGVPDDYFRFVWRSHWEIPAYTQLREMFHRLRPDRAALKKWDDAAATYGRGEAEKNLGPRPASVTRADMREALTIDDVAPGWVDRLIDVSYTPINRTDALRAYQIGAFDEARLLEAFLDLGYSPADARTMLDFYRKEKERRQRGQMKTMSAAKVVRYYKQGAMTQAAALEYMESLLGTLADARRALADADAEVAAERTQAMTKLVRRQLLSGVLSDDGARAALARGGVDLPKATSLVDVWLIERDTRFKQLSTSKAMEMLKQGLMPAAEAEQRLKNLGYPQRDCDYLMARALGVQGEGDGLSDMQLTGAINEAVKNRKEASKKSNTVLMRRLKALLAEAARIQGTLRDRGVPSDSEPSDSEP